MAARAGMPAATADVGAAVTALRRELAARKPSMLQLSRSVSKLRQLAEDPRNLSGIEAAGGTPLLVAALRSHGTSLGVAQAACEALASLAHLGAAMPTIVSVDGIPALLAAAATHAASADATWAACAALQYMAITEQRFARAIAASGGIEAAVAVLQTHMSCAKTAREAAGLLQGLAMPADLRASIVAAGGVAALVAALAAHTNTHPPAVGATFACALCNLSVEPSCYPALARRPRHPCGHRGTGRQRVVVGGCRDDG